MKDKELVLLVYLRALAAFFVVISHIVDASKTAYATSDSVSYFLPIDFIGLGHFGVYLFFALSGCTLYISSAKKINNTKDFGSFFVKRFLRIWPAFAISIFVYIIFIEVFKIYYIADKSQWIALFLNEYTLFNVIQYLSLTFNFSGPLHLFNGPYWSLPLEFQYYLLLPFVLLLMNKYNLGLKPLIPVIFGILLYVIYNLFLENHMGHKVFKMAFSFFAGVSLAAIYQCVSFRIKPTLSVLLFISTICISGLVKLGYITFPEIPFLLDEMNLYALLAIFSLALVLFIKDFKVKENRITSIIYKYGEISYSIYLFHMLFIGISVLLVINLEIYGDNLKLSFIMLFSLISSYLFSDISYKYFEKPFILFGRKVTSSK